MGHNVLVFSAQFVLTPGIRLVSTTRMTSESRSLPLLIPPFEALGLNIDFYVNDTILIC